MTIGYPTMRALWKHPLWQRIRRSAHWTLGFHSVLLITAIVLMVLVERLDSHHDQVRQSLAIEQRLRDVLQLTALLSVLSWMWLLARRRLQGSENNYAHLFATAANGMALVGTDGRILRANSSYCAMLGYDRGELDGRAFESLKHPSERGHATQMFALLLSGERETVRNERRYVDRQGAEIWIRSTMSRTPATGDDGARVLVVAEDVSDRVRNEEMLRRSAALVRNASRMAGIDGWFLPLPHGPLQLGAHALQVLDMPREKWDVILAINLSAAFDTMRLALPGMMHRGYGRIINIASVHGLVASVNKAPYVAAKFGLVGLTRVAALEAAQAGTRASGGVTANCICPG